MRLTYLQDLKVKRHWTLRLFMPLTVSCHTARYIFLSRNIHVAKLSLSVPLTSVLFLDCNSKPSFQRGLPGAMITKSLVPVNRLLMDTSRKASRQAEGVLGLFGIEVSRGCRQVLGGQTGRSFGLATGRFQQTIWQVSKATRVLVLAK